MIKSGKNVLMPRRKLAQSGTRNTLDTGVNLPQFMIPAFQQDLRDQNEIHLSFLIQLGRQPLLTW